MTDAEFEQRIARFLEDYGKLLEEWDEPTAKHSCLHCKGTGLAPGDGRTECGFCY